MYIFYVIFEDKVTCFNFFQDDIKSFCKYFQFFRTEQTDRFEHLDMGLRTKNVILGKSQIKNPVISYCKIIN